MYRCMAVVLLLMLIPCIASIGAMFNVINGSLSLASAFEGMMFLILAAFVVIGAIRLIRGIESKAGLA
jgi:hypothetical protein